MTKEEFAKRFDGAEYPLRMTKEDRASLRDLGLVVVYGTSDDLMEFDGAIYDEVGAPGVAYISNGRLLAEPDCVCDAAERLFEMEKVGAAKIACFQGQDGAYWSYRTPIPHATFKIMEDGEVNCKALVFSIHEMGAAQ